MVILENLEDPSLSPLQGEKRCKSFVLEILEELEVKNHQNEISARIWKIFTKGTKKNLNLALRKTKTKP